MKSRAHPGWNKLHKWNGALRQNTVFVFGGTGPRPGALRQNPVFLWWPRESSKPMSLCPTPGGPNHKAKVDLQWRIARWHKIQNLRMVSRGVGWSSSCPSPTCESIYLRLFRSWSEFSEAIVCPLPRWAAISNGPDQYIYIYIIYTHDFAKCIKNHYFSGGFLIVDSQKNI